MLRQQDLYHVGIIVDDFDATLDRMSKEMGLAWTPRIEVSLPIWTRDTGLIDFVSCAVYSRQEPCIEIVQSLPGTIWTAVAGRPLHHLGYWVDDLASASVELEDQGCPKVACAMSNGEMFGMAYHEMPDGMFVELVDRTSFADWPAFLAGKVAHVVDFPG